ncbi:MAG: response regulator transcription factor [Anaerolineales bacterium]|nr:response regulator transcription factor [Anaerolineales bacterium]
MDNSSPTTFILCLERLPENGNTVSSILQRAGYHVTTSGNAKSAIDNLENNHYHLILMDLDIQGQDGMDLVTVLRNKYHVIPLIIITSNASLDTAIRSIQLGVRDYLVKPIAPDALNRCVARAISDYQLHYQRNKIINQTRDLLKKLDQAEIKTNSNFKYPGRNRVLRRGQIKLDLDVQRATINGQSISLSPTTFEYLVTLAKHSPKPVTYEKLVHEAQGSSHHQAKYRDIARWHVHKLRKTIEPNSSQPRHIVTIRGVGYCLIP